jgi:hypothetical protein
MNRISRLAILTFSLTSCFALGETPFGLPCPIEVEKVEMLPGTLRPYIDPKFGQHNYQMTLRVTYKNVSPNEIASAIVVVSTSLYWVGPTRGAITHGERAVVLTEPLRPGKQKTTRTEILTQRRRP